MSSYKLLFLQNLYDSVVHKLYGLGKPQKKVRGCATRKKKNTFLIDSELDVFLKQKEVQQFQHLNQVSSL